MAEQPDNQHDHINPEDDWPELTAIAGIIESVRDKLYKTTKPIGVTLTFKVVLEGNDKQDGRHVGETYIIAGTINEEEDPKLKPSTQELHKQTVELKTIIAEELDYAFNGDTEDRIIDHSVIDNPQTQLNVDNLPIGVNDSPNDDFLIHLKDLEEPNAE